MTETAHTRTISGMLEVFADGGSRGNPGHAAYAFIVKKDDQIIKEGKGYIGIATNNVAEYSALIEALKWLSNNYAAQNLQISLDSQLVVSQLNGIFKVKDSKIRDLFFKVRELEPNFPKLIYKHIPRQQNSQADKLVNTVLDEVTLSVSRKYHGT